MAVVIHGQVDPNPTLTKIDHVLISQAWEMLYPECHLQARSTDHCPLILACTRLQKKYKGVKGFRLESPWLLSVSYTNTSLKCHIHISIRIQYFDISILF
jgi:hypothetical protein